MLLHGLDAGSSSRMDAGAMANGREELLSFDLSLELLLEPSLTLSASGSVVLEVRTCLEPLHIRIPSR